MAMSFMSTMYALDVIHYTLSRHDFDPQVQAWVNYLDIWVVPMLNPDGNWTFYAKTKDGRGAENGRNTNGRCEFHKTEGVDLSRIFLFLLGRGWCFFKRQSSQIAILSRAGSRF